MAKNKAADLKVPKISVNDMKAARGRLLMRHPFFGMIALKLTMKEDPTCATAYTDGQYLGYNPEFVAGLTDAEREFLVLHEAYHVLLLHFARRGSRDHDLFNIAGDHVINLAARDAGEKIIEGCYIDDRFKKMLTETVYDILNVEQKKQGGTSELWDEVREPKNQDGSDMTESQIREVEADIKGTITAAAATARAMGKMPGDLDKLVKKILKPQVNWKEVLSSFVTNCFREDYTWTRPNSRYLAASGIYLPGLHSPGIQEAVFAYDTSGSITDDINAQFYSELSAVINQFDVTMHVIFCDSNVRGEHQTVTRADLPLQIVPKGGGGTAFSPVFNYVEKSDLNPRFLVYLTDLCCKDHGEDPGYPVIWICTTPEEYIKEKYIPPFGTVVYIR